MGVGLGVRRGVDDVAVRDDGRDRLVGVLDPREVQKQNRAFAMFGLVLVLTGVFLFVLHFVYAGFGISGAVAVSCLFF
jgi:hypothetical protein